MIATTIQAGLFPVPPSERWATDRSVCGEHWHRNWHRPDGELVCVAMNHWNWDEAGWNVQYVVETPAMKRRRIVRDRGWFPRTRTWRFGTNRAAAEALAERLETLLDGRHGSHGSQA
jgi:hypothetical protein